MNNTIDLAIYEEAEKNMRKEVAESLKFVAGAADKLNVSEFDEAVIKLYKKFSQFIYIKTKANKLLNENESHDKDLYFPSWIGR